MTDNLFIGSDAREKMMAGVRKCSRAVGVTLGTGGSNSLIECIERPGHYPTNDGATILENIKLADPLEEIGRKVIYEAVSRANKSSGDGSSTTTVLTAAILEEGAKYIGKVAPMEIKRSLEKCYPVLEKAILDQKKKITVENVAPVASISAEDEEIGKKIQEIYQQIGKGGIIHWDVSKTGEDSYTIGSGLHIEGTSYASPYMCDVDEKSGKFLEGIRWKNVHVLLLQQKLTGAAEFNDLFQSLFNQDIKEIVIFCDEYEVPAITDLVKTRAIRGFKSMVIKVPVIFRDEWWQDLAEATGGKIVGPATGLSLKNVTLEDLGHVENMVVTKNDAYLDGIQDLTSHIMQIAAEGTESSALRASRLNTRTARYFVGAQSESALAYRRLKVEDAINAASCALENGIVPGGGVVLLEASKTLGEGIGDKILKEALKSPLVYVISNAGYQPVEGEITGEKLVHVDQLKNGEGFNSRTAKVEKMIDNGIVDPTDVVLNALKNAISVAAGILTIGTVVTLPKEDPPFMLPGAVNV